MRSSIAEKLISGDFIDFPQFSNINWAKIIKNLDKSRKPGYQTPYIRHDEFYHAITCLLIVFKSLLRESKVEIMLVLRNNFFKNVTFGLFGCKTGFVRLFPLSNCNVQVFSICKNLFYMLHYFLLIS